MGPNSTSRVEEGRPPRLDNAVHGAAQNLGALLRAPSMDPYLHSKELNYGEGGLKRVLQWPLQGFRIWGPDRALDLRWLEGTPHPTTYNPIVVGI